MATAKPISPSTVKDRSPLPDIPEREPDEKMTAFDHLHRAGNAYFIAQYLLDQGAVPDQLLVSADHWITPEAASFPARARYPDLMVAFHVDPAAHRESNGYIIAEQGKPPDFVLEVASKSTAAVDLGAKRDDYEHFGIAEYWRFDETGEFHGDRLAGERLVDGRFEPIPLTEHPDGSVRGYSAVLHLELRWTGGALGWHDPSTGSHIPTFLEERARADAAEAQADAERRRNKEAGQRIRQLEAELRRLQMQ